MTVLSDHSNRPQLIESSFARSGHSERSAIATATFSVPPAPNELESALKRKMVDSALLRIDLNFFGLTPLADPHERPSSRFKTIDISLGAFEAFNPDVN